jgi:hypothetical protein
MRARRARGTDHFDLLPFIAILMCVMGSLLLVTLSVAALSIGPSVGEGWIPSHDASTVAKVPVLVEWDGKVATMHAEGRRLQAKWSVGSGQVVQIGGVWYRLGPKQEQDPGLARLLDDLAARRDTHYALFAVRPSGFDTFNAFADEFRNRKIDIGYEPIKQQKGVRLLRGREVR